MSKVFDKFDSMELQLTKFQSTLAGLVDLPDRIQDMETQLSELLDAKFADVFKFFDTLVNKFQSVNSSLTGLVDVPELCDKVCDLEA